ncbi:hypothetical protein M514_23818 [Trichuris suis]|uniref:Uncharacterized protein n=1 Tax=Trichuris suis TaxID=68888 RepID=A0A085N3C4_9BILA|nr:hypothetical protein M514_23818 [Trichuris suis]
MVTDLVMKKRSRLQLVICGDMRLRVYLLGAERRLLALRSQSEANGESLGSTVREPRFVSCDEQLDTVDDVWWPEYLLSFGEPVAQNVKLLRIINSVYAIGHSLRLTVKTQCDQCTDVQLLPSFRSTFWQHLQAAKFTDESNRIFEFKDGRLANENIFISFLVKSLDIMQWVEATFININAKLSGLFWAHHQREVRRSPPGLYACKPLHPTDFGMDRSCQLKP